MHISDLRYVISEKQLLEAIGTTIQQLDASQTPTPEQIVVPSNRQPSKIFAPASKTSAPATKIKAKSSENQPGPDASIKPSKMFRTRVPLPPQPIPDLNQRYTRYTPLAESGVLIDTVKVAIKQAKEAEKAESTNAQGQIAGASGTGSGAGGTGAQGAGAGKGKRKVIRVRG